MIAIEIQFNAGRFHATPWGRHANEAQPEWPPSPWRILRALIAVWKRKCPGIPEQDIRAILGQIAEPPAFCLPPATRAHTRHYMPWFKKGPLDKTLIFDSFVAVEKDSPLIAIWPDAELPDELANQLSLLLSHLNNLGRAETWTTARLIGTNESESLLPRINAYPTGSGSRSRLDVREKAGQSIQLLCPDPESCFSEEFTPKPPVYDPDWALCFETLDLHANRMIDPPGSKWVVYTRPSNVFEVSVAEQKREEFVLPEKPQIARFILDSSVLPLLTDALRVAEDARWNFMGYFGKKFDKRASPVLSGKNPESGEPLKDHGHAYYLCTDEDGDGRIDHLTLIAKDGFGPEELSVIDSIRRIKCRDRDQSGHSLHIMLMGLGTIEEYQPKICLPKNRFVSETPFIAHRHLKKRGTKRDATDHIINPDLFLKSLLLEELERWLRGNGYEAALLESTRVTSLRDSEGVFRLLHKPGNLRPIQFKRFRRKKSDDGGRRMSGFFEIEFPEPVIGPISVGHSSHFGLGLFTPSPTP